MFAVYGMSSFSKTDPARAQQAFDQFEALYRKQRGYIGTYWLYNESASRYGFLTLWQSSADAETGAAAVGPQRGRILADNGFVPDDQTGVRETFTAYYAPQEALA